MTAGTPVLPIVSFILPARNEARWIPLTIAAIHEHVPTNVPYEVIVVDNGSTDDTAPLAQSLGATVIRSAARTIGASRNIGVRNSSGKILVFLDADVAITAAWGQRFPFWLSRLQNDQKVITGSVCTVPPDPSWIERTWFSPRSAAAFSHIGSGHMLLTRQLFDQIHGFNEQMETGEDYELSQRAIAAGAVMIPDSQLEAIHYGFPRTLRVFAQREAWHGKSDFQNIESWMNSKVAVVSTLIAILSLSIPVAALVDVRFVILPMVGIFALCFASAWRKYPDQNLAVLLINSGLFYVYFCARAIGAFIGGKRRRD